MNLYYNKHQDIWEDDSGQELPKFKLLGNNVKSVPRDIAEEAYEEYVLRYGVLQSLQRIEERGGFTTSELLSLLIHKIKRLEADG